MSRSDWWMWRDGAFTRETSAWIDLRSPAFTAGQSLFETILVRPFGRCGLYRFGDHLDRLLQSADRLGWDGCPSREDLNRWLLTAAAQFRREAEGFGRLRMTLAWVSYKGPPVCYITIVPYVPPTEKASVVISRVKIPWGRELAAPKSGSRAPYALAEREAVRLGCDEALLVDDRGRPVEGARSNLFVLMGERLVTAPVQSGVLPGVTRRAVIRLASALGVQVEERPPGLEEVTSAGLPFLTNALWGVRSAVPVGGRRPEPEVLERTAEVWPAFERIRRAFEEDVARELLKDDPGGKLTGKLL